MRHLIAILILCSSLQAQDMRGGRNLPAPAPAKEPEAPFIEHLSASIDATPAAIFTAAMQELAREGYPQITGDRELGIICTGQRRQRLTNEQVYCPGSFGIGMAGDYRTNTSVAWTILQEGQRLTVSANIDFEYLAGDSGFHAVGFGRSHGIIEAELVAAIRKAAALVPKPGG